MYLIFDKIKYFSLEIIIYIYFFFVYDIVCWYLFINKFIIFCISIILIFFIVRLILNLFIKVFFVV